MESYPPRSTQQSPAESTSGAAGNASPFLSMSDFLHTGPSKSKNALPSQVNGHKCADPEIEVIDNEGIIEVIRIHCRCGEVMEIHCDYGLAQVNGTPRA